MLNLVLADNFLLLFLGWEGVGLCSYFLIGFWYEKKFTGDAAKKAFIINRIGDFGFMLAMFYIFTYFNTLEISKFLDGLPAHPIGEILVVNHSLAVISWSNWKVRSDTFVRLAAGCNGWSNPCFGFDSRCYNGNSRSLSGCQNFFAIRNVPCCRKILSFILVF